MTTVVNQKPAVFKQGTEPADGASSNQAGEFFFDSTTGSWRCSVSNGTALGSVGVANNAAQESTTATGSVRVANFTRTTSSPPALPNIAGNNAYRLPNDAGSIVTASTHTWQFTSVVAGFETSFVSWSFLILGVESVGLELSNPNANDFSCGVLTIQEAGVLVQKRVKQGPPNSGPGGVGRALFVDN